MDNPTGLEFDDIERANEQIQLLREDCSSTFALWRELFFERLDMLESLETAKRKQQETERELTAVQTMLSNRIATHERDIANTDRRIVVLLAMFKELDRRHDFTHAEIRGAIKLIEGYAALIATISTIDDIPF